MNFFRLAVLVAIALACAPLRAADPTPTPTPAATPVPNATNLTGFAGKLKGRSAVTIGTARPYRGGANFLITNPAENSLQLKITAGVHAAKGIAPINNRFAFLKNGTFKGRELAPGIAVNAPFSGLYTAKIRRIDFTGNYKYGTSEGTFTGHVSRNAKGRVFVSYAIFATGQTDAIYSYTYSAIAPRK